MAEKVAATITISSLKAAGFTLPPVYPIAGAIVCGYLLYKLVKTGQEAINLAAAKEEKKKKAWEDFVHRSQVEWEKTKIKWKNEDNTYEAQLPNDEGVIERCLVVTGDLDRRLFSHVAAGKLNNVIQGPFHILSRHYSQFRDLIHSPYLADLSPRARSLLAACENANRQNLALAYRNLQDYLQSEEGVNDGIVISELQFAVFDFILKQMTSENSMGYLADDRGRISLHFRVGARVLRVVLSKEVYHELTTPGTNPPIPFLKKFRELITAYFVEEKDYAGKLRHFDKI